MSCPGLSIPSSFSNNTQEQQRRIYRALLVLPTVYPPVSKFPPLPRPLTSPPTWNPQPSPKLPRADGADHPPSRLLATTKPVPTRAVTNSPAW